MSTLLIQNIGLLATPHGSTARRGAGQGAVTMTENAWLLVRDGIISALGTNAPPAVPDAEILDARGRLVTPGLVDAHTHLVFGGWREHELALKLRGVPYLEILAQGGGILSTVRNTRAANEDALCAQAGAALCSMLSLGTTTCEAKSGYGLSLEQELKQLRVTRRLNESQPVELVSTFMAAHAVPEEYRDNREGYLSLIIDTMLPAVAASGLAEFCDIFCETGVFSAEESRRVLTAARQAGFRVKIHADEIDPIGGSELAGELGAISAEHLIAAPDAGIASMAKGGTVAVLLPSTSFYLNKPFARARAMIDAGVPVAVASDFNPGSCPSLSLQMAMNLACYQYRLCPEEVLTAVTLNAAAAIGRADRVGSLEVGKQADLLIWDAPNLDFIFYRFGSNLVDTVVKRGQIVPPRRA